MPIPLSRRKYDTGEEEEAEYLLPALTGLYPRPYLKHIRDHIPMSQNCPFEIPGRSTGICIKCNILPRDLDGFKRVLLSHFHASQNVVWFEARKKDRHHPFDVLDREVHDLLFGKSEEIAKLTDNHMF